ncbi:MAG: ABC-2 transporter permease [Clostridium sp.]|uniref:ABC-2 transporter permease n=1 Tax=Clostridium sp. TaxID=1506 RepID=UPI002FCB414D
MISLLKMEFLIQKQYIKTFIFAIVIISTSFIISGGISSINAVSAVLVFLLVVTTIEVEKRSKFNLYLNSMPIKRSDYIVSKYVSALFYIILVNLICFLIYIFLDKIMNNSITNIDYNIIILTVSMELIYISIIEPVFILLSHKYYRIANMITVLGIMFIVEQLYSNGLLLNTVNRYGSFIILIVGAVMFLLSFIFINIIYSKKDVK